MKAKLSQEEAIQIITSGNPYVIEKHLSITIVKYERKGASVFAAFYNKKSKPFSHYRFDTEELRSKYINSCKESETRSHENELATLASYEEKRKQIDKNTIFVRSWGYDQTNIDFYKVLEREGEFVTIQEIGQNIFGDDKYNDRGKCTANPDEIIGEPIRKKISKHATLSIESYAHCSVWNGEPMYWSSYA